MEPEALFQDEALDTAARLRSKHVRTLELLQRTLSENEALKREAKKNRSKIPELRTEEAESKHVINDKRSEYCQVAIPDHSSNQQNKVQLDLEKTVKMLNSLQREHKELKKSHDELKETHEKTRGAFTTHASSAAASRSTMRAEIERLELDLRNTTAEHDRVQQARDSAHRDAEEKVRRKLVSAESSNAELSSECRRVSEKLGTVQDECRELHHEIDSKQEELLKGVRERQELLKTIALYKNKCTTDSASQTMTHEAMINQSPQIVSPGTRDQSRTESLTLECKHLTSLNGNLQSQVDGLAQQIESMKEEHEQEIKLLEQRYLTLYKDEKVTREDSKDFSRHVELKRENSMLRRQIEEMKQLQKKYVMQQMTPQSTIGSTITGVSKSRSHHRVRNMPRNGTNARFARRHSYHAR